MPARSAGRSITSASRDRSSGPTRIHRAAAQRRPLTAATRSETPSAGSGAPTAGRPIRVAPCSSHRKRSRSRAAGERDQLLRLVDEHQHRRLHLARVRSTELLSKLDRARRRRRPAPARAARSVAARRAPESRRPERARQLAHRPSRWAQHRQHQPRGIAPAAGAESTPARTSEDLPLPDGPDHRHQPPRVSPAARAQRAQAATRLRAGGQRTRRHHAPQTSPAPGTAVAGDPRRTPLRIQVCRAQPTAKPLKRALIGALHVDRLRIGEQRMLPAWRDRDRNDRLSQRARHRQLGKTPLRRHRRRTTNKKHAVRPAQLPSTAPPPTSRPLGSPAPDQNPRTPTPPPAARANRAATSPSRCRGCCG